MNWIIIGLLAVVFLFETAVALLNRKHSLKPIPDRVKDVYDEERYQKWLTYSLEMQRSSLFQRGLQLLIMIFFLSGTFAQLEQIVASWTSNPILQSLYFLGIVQTSMLLFSIPLKVYRIFSIEERYGFNRTTLQTFIKDLFMSYLLTIMLGGLIVASINALYLKFSGNLWLFIALTWTTIAVIMLLSVAFLGKVLLRLFNKFTPLSEGTLRTRIDNLASSLGFSVKAILVMDASRRSTKSNAAFTGIGKTKEIILFDTLLDKMSEDEIMAVLGHELGHAVHKDTWRLLAQQSAIVALYALGIGLVLQNPSLFTVFGLSGVHFGFSMILFSILFEPVSLLLGVPLNMVSRASEYRADRFSAKHTDPSWMISALKVLSRENLVNLNPHPLAVLLYYSHPPMNDRIQALQ